jgi:hypothetical protein
VGSQDLTSQVVTIFAQMGKKPDWVKIEVKSYDIANGMVIDADSDEE